MKYLICIFIFLASYRCYSQACPLPMISFACGKSAMLSESVLQIDRLIWDEKWDSIKTLIRSTDASLKYLSIQACYYGVEKGKIVLDTTDQTIIEAAKQSEAKIMYCSGCTNQQVYSLKELFQSDPLELKKGIYNWINKMEKIKKRRK